MKFLIACSALLATTLAAPAPGGDKDKDQDADKTVCESHQTVVCQGNGNGGLISLGNLLNGLLGESCSGGDVYCCSESDVRQSGLINLDLNLQCSLNHLL